MCVLWKDHSGTQSRDQTRSRAPEAGRPVPRRVGSASAKGHHPQSLAAHCGKILGGHLVWGLGDRVIPLRDRERGVWGGYAEFALGTRCIFTGLVRGSPDYNVCKTPDTVTGRELPLICDKTGERGPRDTEPSFPFHSWRHLLCWA